MKLLVLPEYFIKSRPYLYSDMFSTYTHFTNPKFKIKIDAKVELLHIDNIATRPFVAFTYIDTLYGFFKKTIAKNNIIIDSYYADNINVKRNEWIIIPTNLIDKFFLIADQYLIKV